MKEFFIIKFGALPKWMYYNKKNIYGKRKGIISYSGEIRWEYLLLIKSLYKIKNCTGLYTYYIKVYLKLY